MISILEKSLDGTRCVFFGPALYSERRASGVDGYSFCRPCI